MYVPLINVLNSLTKFSCFLSLAWNALWNSEVKNPYPTDILLCSPWTDFSVNFQVYPLLVLPLDRLILGVIYVTLFDIFTQVLWLGLLSLKTVSGTIPVLNQRSCLLSVYWVICSFISSYPLTLSVKNPLGNTLVIVLYGVLDRRQQ